MRRVAMNAQFRSTRPRPRRGSLSDLGQYPARVLGAAYQAHEK